MWYRNEIVRDVTQFRESLVLLGLAGALLVLATVAGCGDGRTIVPVSGRVTLEGTPVGQGKITFMPTGSNEDSPLRPASSALDREGRYQLSTFGSNDGAMPGEYNVVIISLSGGPTISNPTAPEVWAIPEHYGRVGQSGLSATVLDQRSPMTFDFDLKYN